MRYAFTIALLFTFLVGIVLGVLGLHEWQVWKPRFFQPVVGPVAPTSKVAALGRVEPADGVILLGTPVPDRLLGLMDGVYEGAKVKADQPLAELSSRVDREHEYRLICAQIKECQEKKALLQRVGKAKQNVAEVQVRQLDEIPPLEIKQQQAKLDHLKRQAENARHNLGRLKGLSESAVAAQEREQQELLLAQAETEYATARLALDQLKKGSALKRRLAEAERSATEADLLRAEKELPMESLLQQQALAKHRLEQTILRAPCAGDIIRICAHAGELVGGQQPILQIANTSRMAVIAEVYETDIEKVHKGQRAEITGRAWPGRRFGGTVKSKGDMVGRNRIVDSDPTARVDRRVVEVVILLDDSESARRLVYHQVSVEIALESSAASPGGSSAGGVR